MSASSNDHKTLAGRHRRLQDLAEQSLHLWGLPRNAHITLMNVSENVTYLVEVPGGDKAVLRIHREGYHTRRAIECELAWLDALQTDAKLATPQCISGVDGNAIQELHAKDLPRPRYLVLFEFLDGRAPDETGDLAPRFEALGEIAARCHDHVMTWKKPSPFERPSWNIEAVFGEKALWGNWRAAPGVTPDISRVLERVEVAVREHLAVYGNAPTRYNLIHADMRLANLLIRNESTRLIDFDDCGHGWLMYDFAAAISFIEDDHRVPELKAAGLKGYRRRRALEPADEAEIDTMIMLRRMALLAWVGSHYDAPEAQAMAPTFAEVSARLGSDWLQSVTS
ncbi:MAG: phosphotransferase [Pseudomonadota bacterium]